MEGFWTYRISDINIDVPSKITWTVEFLGVDGDESDIGNRAALILSGGGGSIQGVGNSLDDFWQKK